MYNKSILLGRLTKDPQIEKTKNNKSVVNFTVACGYGENVDFVKCKAYDDIAENLCKYQRKGNLVLVDASIRTYVLDNGKERTYHQDIVANKVQYADSKKFIDDPVVEAFDEEIDSHQLQRTKKERFIEQEDEGIEM